MRKPDMLTYAARTAVAALGLAACAGDPASPNAQPSGAPALGRGADRKSPDAGAVYTLTNAAGGNAVLAFRRAADGTLSALGTFATGGTGSGGGIDPLQSQYAVLLSDDHRLLFAVNAGDNSVTSFRVADDGALSRADRDGSGGVRPVSLALSGNLLYVLNAGDNVVHGYRAAASGTLAPLPGATRALAAGAAGASTIHFSADGRALIVTERVSNRLETFPVLPNGRLGAPVVTASSGMTPFGFDVAGQTVVVSEAAGAAPDGAVSSYRVDSDFTLDVVTPSLPVSGAAACWVVATGDGRYAYTINSASATITGLAVGRGGLLTRLDPVGLTASTGAGSTPIDPALSRDDAYLYVLNAGAGTIGAFRVGADHGLTAAGDTPVGAPASGLQGLAAF